MNSIRIIFAKELTRIFKDKKMVFGMFILPVLLMVGIMTLMSNMIGRMEDDIEAHQAIIYIQNQSEGFNEFLSVGGYYCQIETVSTEAEREAAEKEILAGEADLLIEFPADFDRAIAEYQSGEEVPQVKTYYNPSEDYSNEAFNVISGQALEEYRQQLLETRLGNIEEIAVYHVNSDNPEMVIQDEQKASGKAVGMMLPYFVTILLFAGAMGTGPDMIAGEKERGTMASMLMTPVKRSSIALGKVFALMTTSGLSALVSVATMVLAMPLMARSMTGTESAGLSLNLNVSQVLMMVLLILAVAFLYSTIIALISVFAKDTKEASTYVMPVYMAVLVAGLMSMFQTGKVAKEVYWIPVYNSAMALKGILSEELSGGAFIQTLGITILLSVVFIAGIVKAFNSEKIMSA